MKAIASLSLAALLALPGLLYADGVFTWVDEHGITHYSSSKDTQKARLAELPPIMRGEVKLTNKKLVSCAQHGGVDCPAGADSDGSVICLDGFKNATTRFRFSCNSPRLKVAELVKAENGNPPRVLIRNSNSVAAEKPLVEYRLGSGKTLTFNGPEEIAPFGVGEFTPVEQIEDGEPAYPRKLSLARLTIKCENCSQ